MSENHVQVASANAQFANQFYSILAKESGNIFFSPISAHSVLSMAYLGAAGKTAQEFMTALKVTDTKITADGYKHLMNDLNNVKNITLHIANKIFLMQNYPLKSTFSNAVSEFFLSEIEPVNFADNVKSAQTINQWVEKKTNSKIKDLISSDSVNAMTRLVLVNAIYFKGDWAHKFDKGNTKKEPFYIKNDSKVECNMMHLTRDFRFSDFEELDAKVLEMPYANRNLSMVVILPNSVDGIDNLEKNLEGLDLSSLTRQLRTAEVEVSLPRFKIEATMDLKSVLEKMGLKSMFQSCEADFSGISDSKDGLYVSKVIQKAFIEVNEEGAEAAAATGLMADLLCVEPIEIFNANHPFIVILNSRINNDNNVLFLGRITDPAQ